MTTHRPLRTPKTALALAVLIALGTAPTGSSRAAVCTFSPASGNWNVAGNWSCGAVPGAADSATVAGAKTVTVNSAQSILNLSNAGSVNLDAFLLTLAGGGGTTNTGTINVGAGAIPNNAALQISVGHGINNAGGVIHVSADSVINQLGSTITGGTINTTGSGKLVAFNNGGNFLSGVTLAGRLDMAGGTGIERIVGGLTLNNATIDIGANSVLAPQGDQTFAGTGSIVFANDGSGSNRLNVEAGHLTLASGITVRGGSGTIGQQAFAGGGATLTNNGVIAADVGGTAIALSINGNVNNNGTLKAENGGTLNINSNVIGGVGSQIVAGAGSVVNQNGVTLSGAMNIIGTGSFRANNNGGNFLSGVSLAGTLDLASATGIERVSGGLTMVNNAVVNIGSNSVFAPQGDQSISGSGTIVFADAGGSNRLNVEAGTLTLASGITVRGGNGVIGNQSFVGGGAALVNHGVIQADVAGRSISLGVNGLTTNHGTLAALNGGTLNLDSAVAGTAGSQIIADAGSVVNQNGVTLSGNMTLSGAGSFRPSNNGNNVLSGVTFAGTLDLASATGLERVSGGLTMVNNAVVNIGRNSILAPQGDQTIAGSGSFVFADDGFGSNRFNVEAGTLTLASGITIRGGAGTIGQQSFVGGAATLINQGLIAADVSGRTVAVTVNGTTVNQNLMKAANGGTLRLDNAVNNSAGTLRADAGSVVLLNGASITGGVLNSNGSGVFRTTNDGNNVINGVTLNGALDLAGATSIARVTSGGMVLNGRIDIGSNSTFAPQGNQAISGTGSIVFADASGSNRFNVEAGTTTIGGGITVHGGTGTIGQQSFAGGAATLINQGLIAADVSGRTIAVTVNGTTVNQNLMSAANGGTLRLDNAVDNSAGTLLADSGSVVFQNGVTITGGQLNSNGSGVFRSSASGANLLNGVTLNGVLDLANATSTVRVTSGGMVLNGRIDIGANSVLAPQGDQTFSGNGSIVFADSSGSNRLNLEAGTTTIGAGVTVRGINGVIGQQAFAGGAATLVNQGTFNSDGGGTISISPNGSIVNDGLLRAQNGTLAVQRNVSGGGSLQVDAAGAMTLANGGNTQGRLLMGAAGAALNLGSGNLVINTDYTNAAAGSGNAFNRRAGVSGSGQILAGGDVQQVISGANVTNGNTANATLTLGNMRVGNNTFNVQIGNAGTTGPTLRGAIQTAVNGGNITDARLSGGAVTPGNYDAGAPGGSSGNLAVNFNVANAGPLAVLSGQAINLRSIYDNIADQKLNLVLGNAAAAYNIAQGSAAQPVTIANQRVGGSNSATLVITNTAAPGNFSEDLNASVASVSGPVTGAGSVSGRLAGSSNTGSGAISVGVATGSAGFKTGTVTLDYQTAGAVGGVSNGLGAASAGSQAVAVSGNVYQPASGQLLSAPLNFGTVQVGQAVSRDIVVGNTAAGASGFVEDLNVAFGAKSGSGTALFDGSGSLNGILAGATSNAGNGSMQVVVNTANAGTINGSIAIQYVSAGAVNGVGNGLGTLAVGSSSLGVAGTIEAQGTVINQASPLFGATSVNLGAVRVGAAAPTATVSLSNQSVGSPQAALSATIASNGAPVTAAGAVNLLEPGQTSSALQVGMSTAVAGVVNGTATVSLVSDASNVGNCAPNCTLNLASQPIAVQGKVYTPAVGQASGGPIDFGIVRVGDTVSARNITITNGAAVTALNDTLQATGGGLSGALSLGGPVSGLGAGASADLAVNLSTASAGVYAQVAQVSFLSRNPDMADVGAGADAAVQVSATVNNLANADFDLLLGQGTLSDDGHGNYVLDLGSVDLGNERMLTLQLDNDIAGPADHLRGQFGLGSVDDFTLGGFSDIGDLAAGGAQGGLVVRFTAGAVGSYSDSVSFSGSSFNSSDPNGREQSRSLRIIANVIDPNGGGGSVPEPGTLALLVMAALAAARRRTPRGVRR